VLDISPSRHIYVISEYSGFAELDARALVLAMGARERTRAQIRLCGTRPAGVYTAGTAQRFTNIEGYLPGRRFVILGSGDIGMIMARRLTFEGARVERVLEVMPFLTGLTRNYVQCLLDFDIPLQLRHTVKRILGSNRVEAVEAVEVDEEWQPIAGSEEIIPCDTLLLSVGLIPENELSRKAGVVLDPVTGGPYVDEGMQTSVPGIFGAGNVVHIYDLVDWVTEAGRVAGRAAARFALAGSERAAPQVRLQAGENVRYVVPHVMGKQSLAEEDQQLQLRVVHPVEGRVWVQVMAGEVVVARKSQRYARPGEMATVRIPQKAYEDVQKIDTLKVNVVPG
jgi:thioredoxin reductase